MIQSATQNYDTIVIGSGMGGLTVASLLAQIAGQRVLLLERHFKAGGFTHSFKRDHYEWDVGLHYVGEMQPGRLNRRIMDLVTGHKVDWHPLGTPFEHFLFPEFSFDVPSDPKLFESKLIDQFPSQSNAIRQYFRDLRRAKSWGTRWYASKQTPRWVSPMLTYPGRGLATQTTGQYLSRVTDDRLRAILAAQWPDFGTPPDSSAFGFHALVATHYFGGAFYPCGGAKKIAENAIEQVRSRGGDCLINHAAEEILVRNGRAVGVKVAAKSGPTEYFAKNIISNASVVTTFNELVSKDYCSIERDRANRLQRGPSASVLFLGLKEDPRSKGLDDANYWVFRNTDHRSMTITNDSSHDQLGAFLSFGSLRNPGQTPHTAQIITFSHEQCWQRYRDGQWKRRGEDYENEKREFAERLIEFTCTKVPQLRELIDFQELATPLTFNTFTGHPGGMIYGQACDARRLFGDHWNCDTSLPGLYLTAATLACLVSAAP